jgi:hypothetical protein
MTLRQIGLEEPEDPMPHRMTSALSATMRQCIDQCLHCFATCEETIAHCLKLGGKHAEPEHIATLRDCALLCATSAELMTRNSPYHHDTCVLCAEACRRCADDCERVDARDGMMQECAAECRSCADACDRMARAA